MEGVTGAYKHICHFSSKGIKKELKNKFKIAFKEYFCWCSNPSNDDKIFAYENMYVAFYDLLKVLKEVWILKVRYEKRACKTTLFGLKHGQDLKNRGHTQKTHFTWCKWVNCNLK